MPGVDRERLRQEFSALTDSDLDAYEAVTRRLLAAGDDRSRLLDEILGNARRGRERLASGGALSGEEDLGVRYLNAIEKMQAPVSGHSQRDSPVPAPPPARRRER